MKNKVYVVNRSGHDFSAASRHGELVFLSSGKFNRLDLNTMYRNFVDILKDSKPTDFLVPSGLTTMTTIAASIFAYLHGRINLLLYRNGNYVRRTIVLSGLLGKDSQDDNAN